MFIHLFIQYIPLSSSPSAAVSTVFVRMYLLPLKNIFNGFGCLRLDWLCFLNHSMFLIQGSGYLLL